jgi:tRNA-uridine aminocarboxypropyltransferase
VACVCASIERVANRTGVIILQHPHERFHPIGSARIASLGLTSVRVEPCAPWRVADLEIPPRAALLYPSADARDLAELATEELPRHLVVIDGTWFNAKKIYDAHASLRALSCLRISPREPTRYRIRRQPRRHCLATLEAIICALRLLEPETRGLDRLLDSFAAMIDRQAAYTPSASPGRELGAAPLHDRA